MKITISILIGLVGLGLRVQSAFAQGSLTPPGPPGPAMVTLSQIQPRIPISSPGYNISQPGSYYLTTNLSVGGSSVSAIAIQVSDVTLDLNGYTISSSYSGIFGDPGILIGNVSDITICNGHIISGVTNGSGTYGGPGFNAGIGPAFLAQPHNVRVSNVTVSGVLLYGINIGTNLTTVVENCAVRTAGTYGIEASIIKSSVATDCGNAAIIGDQVFDCCGQSTAGDGIFAYSQVQNSSGYSSNSFSAGILCSGPVENSYGYGVNNAYGIVSSGAMNCYGISDSNYGIYTTSALNCFGISTSNSGIWSYSVTGCFGQSTSAIGIYAQAAAENSYGTSSTLTGVDVPSGTATGCTGFSSSGAGLAAFIATGCHGVGSPALSVTHNLNSF